MRRISLGRPHFSTSPRSAFAVFATNQQISRSLEADRSCIEGLPSASPSVRADDDDVFSLQGWKGFAWTGARAEGNRAASARCAAASSLQARCPFFISAGERSVVEQNLVLIGVLFIPHGRRVVFFLFEYCCAGHVKFIAMDET